VRRRFAIDGILMRVRNDEIGKRREIRKKDA